MVGTDDIGQIPTISQFKTVLADIAASDQDFTSGNFKPGSGGESSFYKLLTGETTMDQLKN
ncbi:hypothetical protein LWM68_15830 [Niabella sp. W65]|nr:hypothetical protein [Niabella sp. W65]MCH7364096.1 hypothetical protein [Niabella sp. W65]ULT39973.1 hypothetical protein KRR40_34655 [Niabella sp. I65]